MSQWEKLLQKLYSVDSDMRFEEIEKILLKYGYSENVPHSGSSHATFRKGTHRRITIPKKSPVKKPYVRQVRSLVEKEENHENA